MISDQLDEEITKHFGDCIKSLAKYKNKLKELDANCNEEAFYLKHKLMSVKKFADKSFVDILMRKGEAEE